MKIALIAIDTIVAIFVAFEVVLRIIARHEHKRFDAMSPADQRKYQEDMHKSQAFSNS